MRVKPNQINSLQNYNILVLYQPNGTFKSGEINVVFSYSSNPDPLKQMLPFVYVGTGLIIALCAASVIYSSNKRKKRIMAELDIEED